MITLALFFFFIIGLLLFIVCLLEKYFKDYSNIYNIEYFKENTLRNHPDVQQKETEMLLIENEVSTIIEEGLMEIEQKYESLNFKNEETDKTTILSLALKNILTSHLNLLKIKNIKS